MIATDPTSEGQPLIHSTRLSTSTTAPPKRLDDQDTNSAINGDFHAPYGVSDFNGSVLLGRHLKVQIQEIAAKC